MCAHTTHMTRTKTDPGSAVFLVGMPRMVHHRGCVVRVNMRYTMRQMVPPASQHRTLCKHHQFQQCPEDRSHNVICWRSAACQLRSLCMPALRLKIALADCMLHSLCHPCLRRCRPDTACSLMCLLLSQVVP